MADQLQNKHVDKRVVHRYVKKAILDEKDLERHLKTLPDLAEQAVPVEAAIEGDELDDGDGAEK